MTLTAAQLDIRIRAEGAQQAATQVRSVGDAVEDTGKRSKSAAERIGEFGQGMRSFGVGMTAGVTTPLIALGASVTGMASDLNEALSATNTVYGSAAAGVIASSRDAATAVGLSQEQYLSATTGLSAYGKMMGLTQGQTATFADQTVSAAADLSSFYNTSPEDALGAIQAGLRGEGDALERYGILMNQASVEQYALEQGIWDGNDAMTAQQLETARSGFILSQLTSETGSAHAAMGDFARTSGGLANQQRILKAELLNLGASMGQVLLPVAMKLVGGFRSVIGVVTDLSPHAQAVVVVIGAIAAAIGPLLIVFGTLLGAVGSVGAAFGTGGMLAWLTPLLGPIGLIVAALVGLGIAYKTNFLGFGDAVRAVGSTVKDAFNGIVDGITGFVDRFTGAFESLTSGTVLTSVRDGFGGIVQVAQQVAQPMQVVEAAIHALATAIRGIGGDNTPQFLVSLASWLDKVAPQVQGFVDTVQAAWSYLTGIFSSGNAEAGLGRFSGALQPIMHGLGKLVDTAHDLKAAFGKGGFMGVIRVIPEELRDVRDAFSLIFRGIGQAITGVTRDIPVLGTVVRTIGDAFTWIGETVDDVVSQFTVFRNAGMSPVSSAVAALSNVFTGFRDTFRLAGEQVGNLTGIFFGLKDAFTSLLAGDWSGVFDGLKDAFTSLLDAIGTGAALIGTLLIDAFNAIDWAGLVSGAVSLLGDAGSALLSWGMDFIQGLWTGAQTKWDEFTGWLGGLATGFGDWLGDLGGPVGTVVTAISTAIDTAWTLISSSWDVIKGWATGIADALGIPSFSSFLSPISLLGNSISMAWELISTAWDIVKTWATNLVADLGAGDFSAFTAPISAIADAITGAWNLISPAWDTIKTWATNIVADVGVPAFDAFTGAIDTIATGIGAAWTLIQAAWTPVAAFVTNVASGLSLPDFSTLNAVWSTISDAINTAWTLIDTAWTSISGWISGLSGSATAPDFTPVTDPIAGIATCIDTAWTAISTAWTVVAGFITNVASGLSIPSFETLCAAFQTIATGIDTAWTAISTAWEQVTSWASDLDLGVPTFSDFLTPISKIGAAIDMAWEPISPAWDTLSSWASTISLDTPDFSAFIAPFQAFSDGIFKIVDFVTGKLGEFVAFLSNIKIPDIKVPDLSWLPFVDGPTKKPESTGTVLGPPAPAGPTTTDAVAAIGLAQSITDAAATARTAMQQIITDGYNLRTEVAAAFNGIVADTGSAMSGFFASAPVLFRVGVQQMMVDSTNAKIGLVQDMTDILTTSATLMGSFFASVPAIFRAGVQQMMIDASNAKIGVVTNFTDLVTSSIAQITVWAATIPTLAAQTAASVMLSISTMKIGVVSDTNDTVSTTLGVFGGWQTGMIGIASRLDASVRGSISTMKSGIVSDVRDAVNTSIAEFGRIGTEGAGKIDSGAGTVGTAAYNMGALASLGVANGIDAYLYRVTNAVNSIVNEVDRALRAGLRVASPSKLTAYYGQMSTEGYAQGITSSLASVTGAVGAMVGTVTDGLSSLGGVRDIEKDIDNSNAQGTLPTARGRYYESLGGPIWQGNNATATNLTDTMKIVADSLASVLKDGEWASDSLLHLPTQAIKDVAQSIGKALAPFEGQANVFESVFSALKNLIATGSDKGAFANVFDPVEANLTKLADMLRGQLDVQPTASQIAESSSAAIAAANKQLASFMAGFKGGPSEGAFGFGIANDKAVATLSSYGRQLMQQASGLQNQYEASNFGNTALLTQLTKIADTFKGAGYGAALAEDGSLILDAAKYWRDALGTIAHRIEAQGRGFWDGLTGSITGVVNGFTNRLAGNTQQLTDVLALYLNGVKTQGEWGGDELGAMPQAVKSAAMAFGQIAAKYEGNNQVFQTAYKYLTERIYDGVKDLPLLQSLPDDMELALASLADKTAMAFGGMNPLPTPSTPSSSPVSSPKACPQQTVTNNNTFNMTVSVKDVEEMIRLSKFVDDLPQAIGLVFGPGGAY